MTKKEKTDLPQTSKQRIEAYLEWFSQENQTVRNFLANSLPAYNTLVSLNAKSFNEFSLQKLAKEQNIPGSYKDIIPNCPICNNNTAVRYDSGNSYVCSKCKKQFSLHTKSICYHSNLDSLTWMKFLHCLLEHYSVKRTCDYCDIENNTYYLLRAKIFYAMEIMMKDVKLYGIVQCDNTFVHTNYKGVSLQEPDYSEENPNDIFAYFPRESRNRGGRYSNATKNDNSICIFTAIDDLGHCKARYVCIGNASAPKLNAAVPATSYLFDVPKKDPFKYTKPPRSKDESEQIKPKKTLLVSDSEAAIKAYAKRIDIPHEYHVYWRDGKPVKLKPGEHDIQRVNALHRRLKLFLQKCNYVSTKYLPGYLIFFEFIENTGASPEAIRKLFEIIVTPDLGLSPTQYKNKYVVPTIYSEYASKNEALKKFSYNQLLAAYMYHQKKQSEAEGRGNGITVQQIMDETGYLTSAAIRKQYCQIVAIGLMDAVCEAFSSDNNKKMKVHTSPLADNPKYEYMLKYYDAFCEMYRLPREQQCSDTELFARLNAKYELNIKRNDFWYYSNQIEKLRLRSVKLSELKRDNKLKSRRKSTFPKCEPALQMFNEIVASYEARGLKKPLRDDILQQIGDKLDLAPSVVASYIILAKRERKKKFKQGEK